MIIFWESDFIPLIISFDSFMNTDPALSLIIDIHLTRLDKVLDVQ
jgi:hypothetical protein